MTESTFWHGGLAIKGDRVLPPTLTDVTRGWVHDWVYVTPDRGLALMYASTCNGWLYEVEPIGHVERDPDSTLFEAYRCHEARIIRRFKPSRQEAARARWAVTAAEEVIASSDTPLALLLHL